MSTAEFSPWREQAEVLVLKQDLTMYDRHIRTVNAVTFALAWAYEQGYAQGRLYEIERARAPVELAGDDHAK